jgi:hypothetical protein
MKVMQVDELKRASQSRLQMFIKAEFFTHGPANDWLHSILAFRSICKLKHRPSL